MVTQHPTTAVAKELREIRRVLEDISRELRQSNRDARDLDRFQKNYVQAIVDAEKKSE